MVRSGRVQRILGVVLSTASILAASAAPTAAKGTLDQSTLPVGGYTVGAGAQPGGEATSLAQVITAGRTGFLDTLNLAIGPWPHQGEGPFRLSVQGVTSGDAPNGTVLASTALNSCSTMSIDSDLTLMPAPAVTNGVKYAIVLEPAPGEPADSVLAWTQGQAAYTGGLAHMRTGAGAWSPSTMISPLALRTYVSDTAPTATPDDTTVTLSQSPTPGRRYDDVTITAHVANTDNPSSVPAGRIHFTVEGQSPAFAALDASGNASITRSFATAGEHDVTARFCPTSSAHAAATTQAPVTIGTERAATVTTLALEPNPSMAWQAVDFHATVARSPANPNVGLGGSVQFEEEDGRPIGPPVALDPYLHARLTTFAPAGTYTVRARYLGDELHAPSTGERTQTVGKAPSRTGILSDAVATPAGPGLEVYVEVAPEWPSQGTPTGEVTITVDGSAQRTTLNDVGQALVTFGGLAPGSHQVKAQYWGDDDYLQSGLEATQELTVPTTPPPPATAAAAQKSAPPTPRLTARQLIAALGLRSTMRWRGRGQLIVGRATNPPLGKVSIEAVTAPRSGTPRAAQRRVRLGRAAVTVAKGQTRPIVLRLTRAARRTLDRKRSLRTQLRIRATDVQGRSLSATTTLTLRKARR